MTQNLGTQVLAARSATEAQIYMDLHPCDECGAARVRGGQDLREDGNGGLVSVYAGTCPGCGLQWSFAFAVPAAPPPAGRIGGSEPSAIIDPGEWVYLSDLNASSPAGPAPSPGDRARLSRAAAAAEEAAKFIPPGLDSVPAEAFTSSCGRAMFAAFPARFRGSDLRERARLYRAGAMLQGWRSPRELAS